MKSKRALLKRAADGDKDARCELVMGNLRLVLSVIQRFDKRGENPDDLFQVGCIGLLKAVQNFDETKQVRFSRFDCIDDQEVAKALFEAVEAWAKEKGMTELCGPLGYSDLDREGLLVEGFEENSTFEEQYNYPYYGKLIENEGFEKDVDWLE